jgi:hypothetical protein
MFNAIAESIRGMTGLRLREAILGHLGPRMAVYVLPTKGNVPTNPLSGFVSGLVHPPRIAFIMDIDDAEAFGKVLDTLITKANAFARPQVAFSPGRAAEAVCPDPRRPVEIPPSQPGIRAAATPLFRPLTGEPKGYVLSAPIAAFPIPAGIQPALILGQRTLALGTTPAMARQALALANQRAAPLTGVRAATLQRLPSRLIFVTINDPRQSMMPELVANVPNFVRMVEAAEGGSAARDAPVSVRWAALRPPRPTESAHAPAGDRPRGGPHGQRDPRASVPLARCAGRG